MFVLQLVLISQSLFLVVNGLQQPKITVQVCQNKDCCKRFGGENTLVQTLQDLVPPSAASDIVIESSGCLSQCGKGPNICIHKHRTQQKDLLMHGIQDATAAATELELSCDLPPQPTLLAAVKVLEKSAKARTSEEKLKFLNSVIKKLTSMPELVASAANAHAHGARAQVYFEIKDYRLAADDARRSIKLLKDLNIDVPSASFRVLVDAEEVSENFEAALEALRQWNDSNPQFATKVAKEAQRVRGKMQA